MLDNFNFDLETNRQRQTNTEIDTTAVMYLECCWIILILIYRDKQTETDRQTDTEIDTAAVVMYLDVV